VPQLDVSADEAGSDGTSRQRRLIVREGATLEARLAVRGDWESEREARK
jgi:hypothetical protein